MHAHKLTQTQKRAITHRLTHAHTHAQTHRHAHVHTYKRSNTQADTRAYTHAHQCFLFKFWKTFISHHGHFENLCLMSYTLSCPARNVCARGKSNVSGMALQQK
jgi:hypothetical protein